MIAKEALEHMESVMARCNIPKLVLFNQINEDSMLIEERTEEHGKIFIDKDYKSLKQTITVAVNLDFDINAFKAALAGVKAGKYSKPLKDYSVTELLTHLNERTESNGECKESF